MKTRMGLVLAFLGGLVMGWMTVGGASAYTSEAWKRSDVLYVISLLERIANRD